MNKISAFDERNPAVLIGRIGVRLRERRLAKGWTQAELAGRAGVAVSTLKLFETAGRGSLQRLAKIAVALDLDGELRGLFSSGGEMESIEAVKRSERQRAPRRKKGGGDGT
ncbi:MAG: helix-turn-helix transcriptional regulator [Verrucomicrobiota bacterium]